MDEKDIKTLLDEEIEDQLEELSGLNMGSEEYKVAVDGLTKLMDRKIEIEKLEFEQDQRRYDETTQRLQHFEDRKDRYLGHSIALAGVVIPAVMTIWGTIKTLNFEKEGTVTTIMGRGFVQKLLPRK